MYVLDTLLNSFRSVLIKFVMISANFQSCISRLNFQSFGLVKLYLIALVSPYSDLWLHSWGIWGGLGFWAFGPFFLSLFGHFVDFSHL